QETQNNLAIGDEVMTTAGLHGVITGLGDTTVDMEIADGVVTRWERVAIRERISEEPDTEDDGATDESDPSDEDLSDEDFSAEGFSADDLTPEDFGTPETRADSDVDASTRSTPTSENDSSRRDGGV